MSSLTITRNAPTHLAERKTAAGSVLVILAALFGPVIWRSAAPVIWAIAHPDTAISSVPLDAAFTAIIGVVLVAIGLAVRARQADEDR
jgi:hypothetical protein